MKHRKFAFLLGPALLFGAATAGARPVVAVLAQNSGTEVTDFLVPYGVISSANAADVIAVSMQEGSVELIPGPLLSGLTIVADMTRTSFDQAHPQGADLVIVPALHDSKDKVTRAWLRAQASKGATLVSICDGALVLAETGLLDGHSATGHFSSLGQRREEFPNVNWVTNARFVHDGKFISSSGVSASLPTSLYLVELLAGRARAREVAEAQRLPDYSARHDSDAFHLGVPEYSILAKHLLFGWPRDVYALELAPGTDEVGLAFAFDMLSRTFLAKPLAVSATDPITTRHGLRVLRTATPAALPPRALAVRIGGPARPNGLSVGEGADAPRDVLAYLSRRYGKSTAAFVAMQVEYPTDAGMQPSTNSSAAR